MVPIAVEVRWRKKASPRAGGEVSRDPESSIALVEKHGHVARQGVLGQDVGRRQVQAAIAIQVGRGHHDRMGANWGFSSLDKGHVALVQEEDDAELGRGGDVEVSITVKIAQGHRGSPQIGLSLREAELESLLAFVGMCSDPQKGADGQVQVVVAIEVANRDRGWGASRELSPRLESKVSPVPQQGKVVVGLVGDDEIDEAVSVKVACPHGHGPLPDKELLSRDNAVVYGRGVAVIWNSIVVTIRAGSTGDVREVLHAVLVTVRGPQPAPAHKKQDVEQSSWTIRSSSSIPSRPSSPHTVTFRQKKSCWSPISEAKAALFSATSCQRAMTLRRRSRRSVGEK